MLATLGVEDANIEHVEIRESIKPLLEGLGEREKRILLLRFFKNMTQSQIAEEIGVSQMHVSRLLTRTLAQLRTSLEAGLSQALAPASSSSTAVLAGCSSPATTTSATIARPTDSRLVCPPQKFHASPS